MTLNRTIWCLWLQGWDQAPEVALACYESWRRLNPGWQVRALDASTLPSLLSSRALERVDKRIGPPEAKSDQIRVDLLHRYGGVWVDATAMCASPLDEWLPLNMKSDFLAFHRPGPDRMIASWFLAANSGSHIISCWQESVAAYWSERRERDDYFWFHKLFAACYEGDELFRELWDAAPKLPANHAFHFAPEDTRLQAAAMPTDVAALLDPPMPVLKLTHKLWSNYAPGTLIDLLCRFGRGESMADTLQIGRTW